MKTNTKITLAKFIIATIGTFALRLWLGLEVGSLPFPLGWAVTTFIMFGWFFLLSVDVRK